VALFAFVILPLLTQNQHSAQAMQHHFWALGNKKRRIQMDTPLFSNSIEA
jgi:hypothetical protein